MLLIPSTTSSTDENNANNYHQFLLPSATLNSTTTSDNIMNFHTTVNISNNDQFSDMIQSSTTLNNSSLSVHSNVNLLANDTNQFDHEQTQTLPIHALLINYDDRQRSSSTATSLHTSIISNDRSNMTLYFIDMFISASIITPVANIHWRGAWDLLDIHLLPDSPCISALISMGIGYFMLYTIYLIQNYLQNFYERNRHNILGLIMTRLYTLLLALAYIQQWRGLWNLFDLTSNKWYHLLGEAVISITFLILMQSVYNLNTAPFIIGIDIESYFLLDSKYTVTVSYRK